jgi:hypothetical protein
MKDEYQVRIEALNLAMKAGVAHSARVQFAHEFEQYILNGYPGEAKAKTPEAPVTEPKAAPGKRTKRASEAPEESGEASATEQQGETQAPVGRPSTRATGFSVSA